MEKELDYKKIYARMAHKCSMKECSTSEIKRSLQRLAVPEDKQKEIIATLQKNQFIDDKRYTRSFVNDKLSLNKWGKSKIVFALMQKGIARQMIDEVLSELSADDLILELRPLLEKKAKTIHAESEYEKRNKLIRFAVGRGFELDDIFKIINQISLQ